MKISGKEDIHEKVKNDNPQEFKNVKVYAGDKDYEAADAEIRNFKVCSLAEG